MDSVNNILRISTCRHDNQEISRRAKRLHSPRKNRIKSHVIGNTCEMPRISKGKSWESSAPSTKLPRELLCKVKSIAQTASITGNEQLAPSSKTASNPLT